MRDLVRRIESVSELLESRAHDKAEKNTFIQNPLSQGTIYSPLHAQ